MKLSWEPARLHAVVVAVVALAMGYGFVTAEIAPLWIAVAAAVLALVQGETTRSKVIPTTKIDDAGLTLHSGVALTPERISAAAKANQPRVQ